MVEELDTSNLVQYWVLLVIDHVVSDNGRKATSLHGEQPTSEQDAVLARNELLFVGH